MNKSKIAGFFRQIYHLPRRLLILPIRFYRKFLSPLKGKGSCRFYPTCSEYAIEAISEWGFFVGGALAFWRILRCNPFGGMGYDPVPKKKKPISPDGEKENQQSLDR